MPKVAIITGAPNDHSRLNGILNYALTVFREEGVSSEVIKVHELPAEDLITANFDSLAINEANKMIKNSDGLVVLTPVYKASYSGILKTYLDLMPQKILEDKIILPLVIGGSFGHLLTIEYALNPVLSALGASHVVNGVFTIDHHIERKGKNQFTIQKEAQHRLKKGLDQFVKEIKISTPLIQ